MEGLPLTPPEAKAYWCGRYILELLELGIDVKISQYPDKWDVEVGALWSLFTGPTLESALELALKTIKGESNG